MKSAGHSNECQQTDDVDKYASSFWGCGSKGANLQATGADAATSPALSPPLASAVSVETQHHSSPPGRAVLASFKCVADKADSELA